MPTMPAWSSHSSSTGSDSPSGVLLAEVFRPNCMEVIRSGTGKSSVVSLLVRRLAREERIDRQHAEGIIRRILEREQHAETAANGLAFPHLQTSDVNHFAGAVGIAPQGIRFAQGDEGRTRLVFLTLSPAAERMQHADLLSRLVALAGDQAGRLRLLSAATPKDLHAVLQEIDSR